MLAGGRVSRLRLFVSFLGKPNLPRLNTEALVSALIPSTNKGNHFPPSLLNGAEVLSVNIEDKITKLHLSKLFKVFGPPTKT